MSSASTSTTTSGSSSRVELRDWQGVGTYLQNKDAKLVTPDARQALLDSWRDITQQEETLDDAILIGLVGGTGVGKSTFINALAGQEVSRSSDRRPTTDRVIVYRHVKTEMPGEVPSQHFAQPEVLHDNGAMEKVVLFDFPDFDSAEKSHTHIIRKYLPYLDVLLVVVDDVKYADRRLYELLSTLDHDPRNIFVMMNKVDRLQDRYGEKTEHVISELLVDLNDKLKQNSGLEIDSSQMYPIAALAVYEARAKQEDSADCERFGKVETMLEGFQEDKHRRKAKERNIDARKCELAESLVGSALGKENEAILSEAKVLVSGWRSELDKAIASVPVDILNDSERRGVRGSRLRQVGPGWGIPFSLFFTMLGEFGRRSKKSVEPTELGQRVLTHYRSFYDSIKNVRARFTSEFSGSKIRLATLKEMEADDALRVTPSHLGTHLQEAVRQEREVIPMSRRWLAHVPGIGTLLLTLWGQVHDVLDGRQGMLWAIFETLNPTFIIGTILGVILIYALTAFVIWLREIQKTDHAITIAEQETRDAVRKSGVEAIDQLDADVAALHAEFEQLESLVSR